MQMCYLCCYVGPRVAVPFSGLIFLFISNKHICISKYMLPSPSRGLFFYLLARNCIMKLACTLPSPSRGLFFYPVPVSPPATRLYIAFCGAVPATDLLTHYFSLQNRCQHSQQAERRKSIKSPLQRRAHRAHPQRSFDTNTTIISIFAKHSNYSITHQIILHA